MTKESLLMGWLFIIALWIGFWMGRTYEMYLEQKSKFKDEEE